MERIFLLSPARSAGKRAAMLTRPAATFELARQVQIRGANLSDVFAFCSGLYFRGKLAYARHFAKAPANIDGVQIITPDRGLVGPDFQVGAQELAEFAAVPVDSREPRFTGPLRESVTSLLATGSFDVVLLGSVATGKYVDTLLPLLGERLRFPSEFLGRGDMSRGALDASRSAREQRVGIYAGASGARTGKEAPTPRRTFTTRKWRIESARLRPAPMGPTAIQEKLYEHDPPRHSDSPPPRGAAPLAL
jgi:hypothetical protein